jgi:hypothetical protein
VVRFESSGSFGALEGMTVAVGWPHGHVQFPTALERAGRLLVDNWIVLLPFAWLGLLWQRYRRLGRDPDAGAAVMVQYEPPAGLTPGAVGTLIDERADCRHHGDGRAPAIRRHLTIRQSERLQVFGSSSAMRPCSGASPPPGTRLLHESGVRCGCSPSR